MFNRKGKRNAEEHLKTLSIQFGEDQKMVTQLAEVLYQDRTELKEDIDSSWDFLNTLRNKPTELDTKIEQIKIEMDRYQDIIDYAQQQSNQIDKKAGSAAATGIAAGVGVAALGPSAAMAIATTFGTASTGTAISALGGAAATNAALAWLGGGALAAGGTGIEGGTAFLALAGPVGWAIAGVGLTAGGVLYNSHNKKAMQADDQQSLELQSGLKALDGTKIEINKISRLTQRQDILLQSEFKEIQLMDSDFEKLDEKSKKQLGAFVNNVLSATKLLNQKVGSNN